MRDTRGATAVEYGLIVGLLVIFIIGALQGFARATDEMWEYVQTSVEDAV
ncbi:hypothetical protein GCM10009127_22010 [Alteraurantiacibacter aestuarii]